MPKAKLPTGKPKAGRERVRKPMTQVKLAADVLEERTRRILDAYFVTLDPVQAFQAVGDSFDTRKQYFTAIYTLLADPAKLEYLKEKMRLRALECGVEERELMRDLNDFRKLSPWDFLEEEVHGTKEEPRRLLVLKPMDQIPRDAARWIKKVKTKRTFRHTQEFHGEDGPQDVILEDVTQEIEFHSVLDVIDKLARMIGAYKDAQLANLPTIPAVVVIPQPAQTLEQWEAQIKAATVISVQ